MKLFIPPQLKRLGLAFAIFISAFLVIRHFLVPKTFGQYGFYRGAVLDEIAQAPLKFTGKAVCVDCHQEVEEKKLEDAHRGISCESCHGPGQKHADTGEAAYIEKPSSRESCGICHSKNAAKKKEAVLQIDLSEHNTGKKCIECHNPHKPWEMKE